MNIAMCVNTKKPLSRVALFFLICGSGYFINLTSKPAISAVCKTPAEMIQRVKFASSVLTANSKSCFVTRSNWPCASIKASDIASACASGNPDSFRRFVNLSVSKVIVAIVANLHNEIYHKRQCLTKYLFIHTGNNSAYMRF